LGDQTRHKAGVSWDGIALQWDGVLERGDEHCCQELFLLDLSFVNMMYGKDVLKSILPKISLGFANYGSPHAWAYSHKQIVPFGDVPIA
jgi:hypothetical protein